MRRMKVSDKRHPAHLKCLAHLSRPGRQMGAHAAGRRAGRPHSSGSRLLTVLLAGILASTLCTVALASTDTTGDVAGVTFDTDDGLTMKITLAAQDSDDGVGLVTVTDGTDFAGGDLEIPAEVTYTYDDETGATVTATYEVSAIGSSAFKGLATLTSVTFEGNLEGPYYDTSSAYGGSVAIASSAFQNCTSLVSVTFGERVAGIGDYAFQNCTSLESVTWPDDAVIWTNSTSTSPVVGASAFKNCASLESITLPAIETTVRKGDAYYEYDDYNAGVSLLGSASLGSFTSGYMGYWHNTSGPVGRAAFGGSCFYGCTSLESIIFAAGAQNGSFSLTTATGMGLEVSSCPSLEAIVFESEQAYWGDPNQSMQNSTFYELYYDADDGESADDAATLYYAVDYYATQEAAEGDDDAASERIARVEFARSTSVAAIATGSEEAEEGMFADSSLYASDEADANGEALYADGEMPDAKEVAVSAGLATADDDTEWVWKLGGGQCRREGLSDSCAAWPVKADELSAARISCETIGDIQVRCDQNLSRWLFDSDGDDELEEQDSIFDASRFASDGTYNFSTSATDAHDAFDDVVLTVTSAGESSLTDELEVFLADGTELDVADCEISYGYWDSDCDELVDGCDFETAFAALGDEGGPLMLEISNSACAGSLVEWLIVEPNSGSVMERFTESSGGSEGSWYAAAAASEANKATWPAVFDSTYAVRASSGDVAGSLVAVGFASLEEAPLVLDQTDEAYGFTLVLEDFSAKTGAISATSSTTTATFTSDGDASAFAVKAFEAFESDAASSARARLGLEDLAWGDAAVLVEQDVLADVAAGAAAWAYAHDAAVFFTEEDGSVSDETLGCLAAFDEVVLFGTTSTFSDAAAGELAEAIADAGGSDASAVSVDDSFLVETASAAAVSMAVAESLVEEGLASASTVTVSDAADPADALGALNRSGLEGGITFAVGGSAESKTVATWLRERRDEVSVVRLFGRSSGNVLSSSFVLGDALSLLWDESGSWSSPVVEAGDTVELSGIRFEIQSGAGTEASPYVVVESERLWGSTEFAAGSIVWSGGTCFEVAETVEETGDSAGSSGGSGSGSSSGSKSAKTKSGKSASSKGASSSGSGSGGGSKSGSGGSSASSRVTGLTASGSGGSSLLGLSASGSSGGASASARGGTVGTCGVEAGYVDCGWDVADVGDVSKILASASADDDDTVGGNYVDVSSGTLGTAVSIPFVVIVCISLSVLCLAAGLVLMLRRRDNGYGGPDML